MLNLMVFFIYTLLSLILTYPLVLHLENAVTNPIDPLFYAWNLEHNFYALTQDIGKLLDTNIFYPASNTLAFSDHLLGQTIILSPLFFFFRNPLLIQNLYLFSTFIFAGFGTFLLTKYLSKNSWVAFLAGIIYSFSLYHFDHLGQVPTTSIQWFPFAFFYLFKSFKTKEATHFLLFWLFFTLNFLSTLYYGIFLTLAVFLFLAFQIIRGEKKAIIKLIFSSLPFLFLLILASYPYFRFRAEFPQFRRTLEEASWRAVSLSDYLRRSPIIHDRALFPGITAIILTVASLFIGKKKFSQVYFLTLLVLFFLLSLGPEKWGIKLPYYYLYKIFPPFQAIRVPARFGILTILSFSLLSAFTLTAMLRSMVVKKKKLILMGGILIFVLWESFHFPLKFTKVPSLSQAPAVYHWLRNQEEDFVILELPLKPGIHANPIEEQVKKNYREITEDDNFIAETFRVYFSILHRKKMLNGYSSFFPPSYMKTARIMENFPSEEAVELLKKRKVKYLIIHTWQYAERWEEIEDSLKSFPQLKLSKKFNQDYVYRFSIKSNFKSL